MKRAITILMSVLLISSCALLNTSSSAISLDTVLSLAPGQDNQNKVVSALGIPNQKMEIPESGDVLWVYNDKADGYHRLSLTFDKSEKLQSVLWLVRSGEPEVQLHNSQKRFPSANFINLDSPWINSHAASDETIYTDSRKGVSIVIRKSRQEVESLGWSNPDSMKSNEERKLSVDYTL